MGISFNSVAPFGFTPHVYLLIVACLVVVASLRLTRFVTTDLLGSVLTSPFEAWASRYDQARREDMQDELVLLAREAQEDGGGLTPPQYRRVLKLQRKLSSAHATVPVLLVAGLGCPFCVGFWIVLLTLALTLVFQTVPYLAATWLVLLTALSLSYITGHVSKLLDK